MHIEIDDKSGFCFGVVKAITKAEESLASGEKVYSLGDIVHNRVEVQRLESLGLETISRTDFPRLEGQTVLIRAHGEPPTTYDEARKYRLKIIDATCPVVAHLQKVVIEAHHKMEECNGQVVILGKRGHAEVVGLTGQVNGDALVVEHIEDLDSVDFSSLYTTPFAVRFPTGILTCRSLSNGSMWSFSSAAKRVPTARFFTRPVWPTIRTPTISRTKPNYNLNGLRDAIPSVSAEPPQPPNG